MVDEVGSVSKALYCNLRERICCLCLLWAGSTSDDVMDVSKSEDLGQAIGLQRLESNMIPRR